MLSEFGANAMSLEENMSYRKKLSIKHLFGTGLIIYLFLCADAPLAMANKFDSKVYSDQQNSLELDVNPTWSPNGSLIAFVSARSGNSDIWVVSADGSNLKNLTPNTPSNDYIPVWSPDGTKIAFNSSPLRDSGYRSDIMVYDIDEDHTINLTATLDGGTADKFSWSPNGLYIAITYNHPNQIQGEIWILDSTGNSDPYRISPLDNISYTQPEWSPDSQKLIFKGNGYLWVTNLDTHETYILTSKPHYLNADWSPNGDIVVATILLDRELHVVSVDTKTGEVINLTPNNPAGSHNPKWSPNGLYIAFTARGTDPFIIGNGTDPFDIWIMKSDGSDLINLTKDMDCYSGEPTWSPDSKQIAFVSNCSGVSNIWTVNVDGSNPINITNGS